MSFPSRDIINANTHKSLVSILLFTVLFKTVHIYSTHRSCAPHEHETDNSRGHTTGQVEAVVLEVEGALSVADLEGVAVGGDFRNHALDLLVLGTT